MADAEAKDSLLKRIVAGTTVALLQRKQSQPLSVLEERASRRPAPRDFRAALQRPGLGLIAEVKKGSPSKGPFAAELDHVGVARSFRDAGAVAISVLTSPAFYAGDRELDEVATALAADERNGGPACPPLLRKEFHVDPYQIVEARALGADAYLIVVKTVDIPTLRNLIRVGAALGMTAFAEVSDEYEADIALAMHAQVLGINNRDLTTFEEDLGTTEQLRPLISNDVLVVAASGVRTRDDLERMRACNVDAILIGEALCTASDPAAKIQELSGV